MCLGRTNRDICPVAAIISYIATCSLSSAPLFRFEDGTLLMRPRLLRATLRSEGIDASKYAGHSFRIGAGIEDSLKRFWDDGRAQRTPSTFGSHPTTLLKSLSDWFPARHGAT